MQKEKDCVSYPFGTIRDNRCKYCLKSINNLEIRCNGYCNTMAHFECTKHAQQKIEIKLQSNHFLCLWCSVYKFEENACQQFQELIAQTEDLSINNDGNFNQNFVKPETSWTTSKISTSGSPKNSNIRSFKSAPPSPNRTIYAELFFPPSSKSSSMKPLKIDNLTTTQQSSNVMSRSPTPELPEDFNLFRYDIPTTSTTSKSEGIFRTKSVSPHSPGVSSSKPRCPSPQSKSVSPCLSRVSSPLKPRCPSPQTKTDSYKKDLQPVLSPRYNQEVYSKSPVLHEILRELKQCTILLNERVLYQKTTSLFERDKGSYLKSLNNLMQSNIDALRTIQTQIRDVQAQCNELCNFSKNILKDSQTTYL
ncbi:hypothetical protein ALC62_04295 [Cyphomyrmex costatus]|uniref:PHD-type domain-containing protein n=1 Tax=Cyphomyrmex costatus TaxID=456900 RepID=A0A195CWA5_9HYME|nr:hypothetical protein ALC62_04295 [Cyphomyrmex costatus]